MELWKQQWSVVFGMDGRLLEVRKANWGPTNKKISIRWSEGVFVVDTGVAHTFAEVLAATEAEKEFLRMLDLTVDKVSLRPSANNYAPKVFSEDVRCKMRDRSGKKALADAMARLVTKRTLATAEYGPPANRHERIVRAFPEPDQEAK
jgi:RecA-family ATPase